MSDPINLVLSKLPDAKVVGENKWQACCPAHEDRRPSLSIGRTSDGTVLIKCHAGCANEAIVAAMGITLRDLFSSDTDKMSKKSMNQKDSVSNGHANGKKARTFPSCAVAVLYLERHHNKRANMWTYHNADGKPVGAVVRWNLANGAKDIRPVSLHEDGWRIGAMPEPRPLYGLPELATAQRVIVCEGEKAADAARSLGFTATTSAGGSNAGSKSDWRPLAGKEVRILPDNDAPGRKYADTLVTILSKLTPPAVVKVVDLPGLPEGGDIVEYIAAAKKEGLDDAAIRARIDDLADRQLEMADMFAPSDGFAGSDKEVEWPEPKHLPPDLLPVEPFDYDMMPAKTKDFVRDVSERMQCPPDFVAVPVMVVLGILIGRKIAIRPKRRDDWSVLANLWGLIVGRPGIMKSPALSQVFKFLHRLTINAKKLFDAAVDQYEVEKEMWDAQRRARKAAIEKAIKDGEDPAVAAAKFVQEEPKKPTLPRYYVNDSTVEKLGEIQNENPNGILSFRDEMAGLMANLDKEGQESARAYYLTAWDSQEPYYYDRIGRGTLKIDSIVLSVLGGTQPGRLANYLADAISGGAGDDGWIQRLQLMVYPDIVGEWRNVDEWPNLDAKNAMWGTIQDVANLDLIVVGAEKDGDGIQYLRYADEAQIAFDAWRADLESRIRSGVDHVAIESHLAKYRKLVPGLSLIIWLADGNSGPVGLEAIRKAIKWASYLESHARRIYGMVVGDGAPTHALARKIAAAKVVDGFTARDVYNSGWKGLSREQTETAIDLLVELNWIRAEPRETGGRPQVVYRINPRIDELGCQKRTCKTSKSPTQGETTPHLKVLQAPSEDRPSEKVAADEENCSWEA